MISTLLGSCVAACLYDPVQRVGGMNHFLLPGRRSTTDIDGLCFGVHAMELLVNALLGAGARRERLKGKLFGGAQMIGGLADVGRQNAAFALSFLEAENILHSGGSLGGADARRVQFWPASGRVRQLVVGIGDAAVFDQQLSRTSPTQDGARPFGAVEMF